MPFVLTVEPQCSHSNVSLVVTVGETRVVFSVFFSLDFDCFHIHQVFSVVTSARLGLVYLFLYPSLFIRSADWRQLFWYLLVFALFVVLLLLLLLASLSTGCLTSLFVFIQLGIVLYMMLTN